MTSPVTTLAHRVQLKNIAVLTDLGRDAKRPLRLAASLAQWYGAKLTVAHAYASDSYICSPPDPQRTDQGTSFSRKQAEERIRSFIGHTVLPHATVSTVVTASTWRQDQHGPMGFSENFCGHRACQPLADAASPMCS